MSFKEDATENRKSGVAKSGYKVVHESVVVS